MAETSEDSDFLFSDSEVSEADESLILGDNGAQQPGSSRESNKDKVEARSETRKHRREPKPNTRQRAREQRRIKAEGERRRRAKVRKQKTLLMEEVKDLRLKTGVLAVELDVMKAAEFSLNFSLQKEKEQVEKLREHLDTATKEIHRLHNNLMDIVFT